MGRAPKHSEKMQDRDFKREKKLHNQDFGSLSAAGSGLSKDIKAQQDKKNTVKKIKAVKKKKKKRVVKEKPLYS